MAHCFLEVQNIPATLEIVPCIRPPESVEAAMVYPQFAKQPQDVFTDVVVVEQDSRLSGEQEVEIMPVHKLVQVFPHFKREGHNTLFIPLAPYLD